MPRCAVGATPPEVPAAIALIGDLHGSWDEREVRTFNASDYDLLIFTGDLGSGTAQNGVAIARSMAGLTKPTLVMPGNNDAPFLPEITAEFEYQRGLSAILDLSSHEGSHRGVKLCGYGLHRMSLGGEAFSVLSGRPCAMGGGEFSFPEELERNYRIADMEESTRKLLELVDAVETTRLVILGHNGPHGLGSSREDIWGCDFRPEYGDWGDPDLAAATDRAKERGHEIVVVAGHMHHGLRGGGLRRWEHRRDGIHYVNPARVPRIYASTDQEIRYHVALHIDGDGFRFAPITWNDDD